MKGKYTLYAILVITLTSGINWMNMFKSSSSSSPRGSTWSSNTGPGGGVWGGGTGGTSGGHK